MTADEGAQRPNVEARKPKKCPGHSVTFPMERLVQDVDVPVENITTMLTYLELSPERYRYYNVLPYTLLKALIII